MLAVDTNVVVRYLTFDDPDQSTRARALVDRNAVFLATTVLLETEWVLRSLYRFDAARIARKLREFGGLPTVSVENPEAAWQALDWVDKGLDFADALHLAGARGCEAFFSFD